MAPVQLGWVFYAGIGFIRSLREKYLFVFAVRIPSKRHSVVNY